MQNRPLFLDAKENLKHSIQVEAELDALESKVAQFVGLCEKLRAENVDLRRQLVALQDDARRLNAKVEGAKTRVEHLIARIPD